MRKIRLGYVSPDFRIHSAAFAFSPVVWGHDRSRFHVTCYSSVLLRDPMTAKHQAAADRWVEAYHLSDVELATMVKDHAIDILVDLAGHTAQTRLGMFAKRAAPIQVSGWGYLAAPGVPEMDWHFADQVIIPLEDRHHYVERIWDLPCVFTYLPPGGVPDIAPLPGLANGYPTFGYLGRWTKVTQEVIDVWAAILRKVPRARLLLKDRRFDAANLCDETRQRFGDVGDRLDFLGVTGHVYHLGAYNKVDVALDPWPMGSGVTTMEALWMGVPSITLYGDRPSSRATSSIMTAAQLRGFIARDVDQYISMGQAWGTLGYLTSLRATTRERMKASALGDTVAYVHAVEDAYVKMMEMRHGRA